jgi:hypothetical protein
MQHCLDVFTIDDKGELVCVQASGAFECIPSRSFFAESIPYFLLVYGGGDFNLSLNLEG